MAVNVRAWLLWGFVGTVVLTTVLSASQGLNLTRMNLPFMLGTIVRPGSRSAARVGFLIHLVNGWLFALVYVATFHAWGGATWWRGAAARRGIVEIATNVPTMDSPQKHSQNSLVSPVFEIF